MKTLDTCKYHVSNGVLTLSNALFSHSIQGVDRATASVKDAGGLSVPYLEVWATSGGEEKTYCIWEDLCAVYMPRFSGGNILTLDGEHWVVSYITLNALVLASNTQAWVRVLDGCTEVHLAKPRAYALIELIYPQTDV